jgi:hypothetical protein
MSRNRDIDHQQKEEQVDQYGLNIIIDAQFFLNSNNVKI